MSVESTNVEVIESDDTLEAEELLVEEVSIDGLCGVYATVTLVEAQSIDLAQPWTLSDQVSLRDESFGALAYHHGNRRLIFLKSPALVEVVRHLAAYPSALDTIAAYAPAHQASAYAKALTALARSEIIHGR